MREERFPWALGAILVLAIVGGIGFWVGSSSVAPVIVPVAAPVAPAPVAPAPVTPIYPAYAPHGGGFSLFPLFFGLIGLVVIVKAVRHAAWSGYQRGGPWSGGGPGGQPAGMGDFSSRGNRSRHHRSRGWYGPGSTTDDSTAQAASDTGRWTGRDVPPMVDEMFQRWHGRMHAAQSSETVGQSEAPSASPTEDDGGSLNIPPTRGARPTDPSI